MKCQRFLLSSKTNLRISAIVLQTSRADFIPSAHLFLGNRMTSSISGWLSNKALDGSSTTQVTEEEG